MRIFSQILIVIVIIGLIYGVPEYFARQQARKTYDSIELNSKMSIDGTALESKRKELKFNFINFFPDDTKKPNGTGGVVMVFLGGFPFGKEYCVLNLKNNIVTRKRLFFDADDYWYCKGDVHYVYDCN